MHSAQQYKKGDKVMNEKDVYFRYGEIVGRIEAVLTYCNKAPYVDKDVLKSMLEIPERQLSMNVPEDW